MIATAKRIIQKALRTAKAKAKRRAAARARRVAKQGHHGVPGIETRQGEWENALRVRQ